MAKVTSAMNAIKDSPVNELVLLTAREILEQVTDTSVSEQGALLTDLIQCEDLGVAELVVIPYVVKEIFELASESHNKCRAYARVTRDIQVNVPASLARALQYETIRQASQALDLGLNTSVNDGGLGSNKYSLTGLQLSSGLGEGATAGGYFFMANKWKSLGLFRFIGELLNCEVVQAPLVMQIVQRLVDNVNDRNFEFLHMLLTTAGRTLEICLKTETDQLHGDGIDSGVEPDKFMENLLQKLKRFSNDTSKVSLRARVSLSDLLELWENGWISPAICRDVPKTVTPEDTQIVTKEASGCGGDNQIDLLNYFNRMASKQDNASGINELQTGKKEDPDETLELEANSVDDFAIIQKGKNFINRMLRKRQTAERLEIISYLETPHEATIFADVLFQKAASALENCAVCADIAVKVKNITAEQASFGEVLSQLCFSNLETGYAEGVSQPQLKSEEIREENGKAFAKKRRRCLGGVAFAGELLRVNIIPASVLLDSVTSLLSKSDVISLDILYVLLLTSGKFLDLQLKKTMGLDLIFNRIKHVCESRGTLPQTLVSALRQLVHIRCNNWPDFKNRWNSLREFFADPLLSSPSSSWKTAFPGLASATLAQGTNSVRKKDGQLKQEVQLIATSSNGASANWVRRGTDIQQGTCQPNLHQGLLTSTAQNTGSTTVSPEEEDKQLLKCGRKILNNLKKKGSNFNECVIEFCKLLQTPHSTSLMAEILYKVAAVVPEYSKVFANLVLRVQPYRTELSTLRDDVLNHCLQTLEAGYGSDEELSGEQMLSKERFEEMNSAFGKARRRCLGSAVFLGELLIVRMVKVKFILDLMLKLLYLDDIVSYEILYVLMTTTGKHLEVNSNKKEELQEILIELRLLEGTTIVPAPHQLIMSFTNLRRSREKNWSSLDQQYLKMLEYIKDEHMNTLGKVRQKVVGRVKPVADKETGEQEKVTAEKADAKITLKYPPISCKEIQQVVQASTGISVLPLNSHSGNQVYSLNSISLSSSAANFPNLRTARPNLSNWVKAILIVDGLPAVMDHLFECSVVSSEELISEAASILSSVSPSETKQRLAFEENLCECCLRFLNPKEQAEAPSIDTTADRLETSADGRYFDGIRFIGKLFHVGVLSGKHVVEDIYPKLWSQVIFRNCIISFEAMLILTKSIGVQLREKLDEAQAAAQEARVLRKAPPSFVPPNNFMNGMLDALWRIREKVLVNQSVKTINRVSSLFEERTNHHLPGLPKKASVYPGITLGRRALYFRQYSSEQLLNIRDTSSHLILKPPSSIKTLVSCLKLRRASWDPSLQNEFLQLPSSECFKSSKMLDSTLYDMIALLEEETMPLKIPTLLHKIFNLIKISALQMPLIKEVVLLLLFEKAVATPGACADFACVVEQFQKYVTKNAEDEHQEGDEEQSEEEEEDADNAIPTYYYYFATNGVQTATARKDCAKWPQEGTPTKQTTILQYDRDCLLRIGQQMKNVRSNVHIPVENVIKVRHQNLDMFNNFPHIKPSLKEQPNRPGDQHPPGENSNPLDVVSQRIEEVRQPLAWVSVFPSCVDNISTEPTDKLTIENITEEVIQDSLDGILSEGTEHEVKLHLEECLARVSENANRREEEVSMIEQHLEVADEDNVPLLENSREFTTTAALMENDCDTCQDACFAVITAISVGSKSNEEDQEDEICAASRKPRNRVHHERKEKDEKEMNDVEIVPTKLIDAAKEDADKVNVTLLAETETSEPQATSDQRDDKIPVIEAQVFDTSMNKNKNVRGETTCAVKPSQDIEGIAHIGDGDSDDLPKVEAQATPSPDTSAGMYDSCSFSSSPTSSDIALPNPKGDYASVVDSATNQLEICGKQVFTNNEETMEEGNNLEMPGGTNVNEIVGSSVSDQLPAGSKQIVKDDREENINDATTRGKQEATATLCRQQ